jgi:hypothetical protein|tara:strand:+ start:345 stop:563 length:219 start_codon:yes stop_codon:yes gene_type:complete
MNEDIKTLKLLVRNKRELEKAEEKILQAIAMDFLEGLQTEVFVTQKVFEISNLILALNESIKKCQEKIRKKS